MPVEMWKSLWKKCVNLTKVVKRGAFRGQFFAPLT